jgi:HAD superfamily hydrolase (TIGR01509 family)
MAKVLTELGCPIGGEEAVARYSGLRWRDCHARIERDFGRSFDSNALGARVDAAIEARAAEMPAIDGLDAFLKGQTHRRLAIASSSETSWLHAMLRRLALDLFFGEHVYSAARIPKGKPHPDVYLHVAEQLRVPPSACLVIEDHPVGAAAGVAAGMTVIGLLAASHIREGHEEKLRAAGVRHCARDYAEVAEILARLEAP